MGAQTTGEKQSRMRYFCTALQQYKGYNLKSAYHTVVDKKDGLAMLTMSRKWGSSHVQIALATKSSAEFLTLSDICSTLTSDSLEPPSTVCPFQISCCGVTAINRNTYGVNDSPIPLLQYDCPSHPSAKKRRSLIQPSNA